MASPFDFSAFLLTPPIPNYSNNYSTSGNNDAQNRQQFNEPNSTDGGPNDYSQNPSNPVPTQSYPTSINAYGGQRQESLSQSHTAFPPQSNNDTYQPVQQSQQNSALYLSPDQRGSDAQSNYGSYNPSSFSTFREPMNNQQMYSSSVPSTAVNSAQTTSNNLPPVASGSNPKRLSMSAANMPSLDERDYGLDPSAFSNVTFQMPSFLQATTQPGEYGDGPPVVDPSAFRSAQPQGMSIFQPGFLSGPTNPGQHVTQSDTAPPNVFQQKADSARKSVSAAPANQKKQYVPDPKNPVYGIYGSSVISVNPDPSPFKLALNNAIQPKLTAPSESRSGSPDFDPKSLGLPVGDQLFPQALPGLYSSSGFDMLGVLARVVARPNPQINIGPVDTSCSFLVVDARRYDMPIVFASDTFSKLTGYHNADIIGRNCRFLQAPDGNVLMGSRRKYTDPAAVYHLKTHIQSGKETQASIINYRKDGSPFINLVTVIPISWDTDEIAYFVGFQVDLVEQPNAILEKMRNGTYVVNYSLLPTNSGVLPAVPALAAEKPDIPEEQPLVEEPMYVEPRTIQMSYTKASGAATAAAAQSSMTIAPELLEVMGALGTGDELDDDAAKKRWNKMLLDHTGDFVHVLSLKGSFLYVSPSVTSMLEYEPSDLVGKTLQSVCHPSDIVPVMRELKDSSNASQQVINLLYRFRRKHSGYIWLEAQGKLYLEQSKSRKCVILVGRERPVYQLSWQDLRAAGGLGEKEYWSKITVNGMFLYNTPSVRSVVGHEAQNLQGKSMFDYIDASKAPELAIALNDARAGKSVRMRYKLKNARGSWVDVITNFFPNMTPSSMDGKRGRTSTHPTIVLQTNEYASEMRRRATMGSSSGTLPFPTGVTTSGDRDGQRRPTLLQSSSYRDMVVTTPDASDDGSSSGSASGSGSGSDSSAPSTFSAIPSTYKTLLSQAKTQSDNLFDELDTTRTTSWQYELHQLKLTNKKLKEELAMLEAAKRKRKKKDLSGNNESSTSAAPSRVPLPASNPNGKTCANCGRTDSPEWRVGPSGSRNLCNACGLRWAKATRNQRQSSSTPSGSASSSGNSDMEAAASYLQPVGPFALHRPPFQHAESSRFNQSGH